MERAKNEIDKLGVLEIFNHSLREAPSVRRM